MAIKSCENCKKEIVFYANEVTSCPHCSHKHQPSEVKIKSLNRIKKIPKASVSEKSFWAALAFFIFFSQIGAHRLYVGKIASGIFMLVSFFGYFIFYFGIIFSLSFSFVGGLFGICFIALYLYDLFSLILGNFEDVDENPVKP